ncbi:hypothetical protein [Actinospica robiniae]|uniref:hypothetical protein n=1 Tax=Actinospica robiniae TaxID=304901 RepID=UPI0012FC4628|nr:hypothetical protein [Actinospica robiniae]
MQFVDEREAFSRRRVMDQRFGRVPQDVGFLAQRLQLAFSAARLSAGVGKGGFEITWHSAT